MSPDEQRTLLAESLPIVDLDRCYEVADILLAPGGAVDRIARERAAEALEAMATVFDADARHLQGGKSYMYAAQDCRIEAATLRATLF